MALDPAGLGTWEGQTITKCGSQEEGHIGPVRKRRERPVPDVTLCSLQDLAWMITFYVRIALTYTSLLGVKGLLGLFFMVR